MAQATIISGSCPDGPVAPQTHYHDNCGGFGSASFPTGEPAPVEQPQGFTMTAPNGLPVAPRDARPDTIVTLPNGEQWSLGALLVTGDVIKLPSGEYVLPGSQQPAAPAAPREVPYQGDQQAGDQAATQAPEQQPEQQRDQEQLQDAPQDGRLFSREVAEVIDDLAERAGHSATASLIMELADGREPSASTLAKIASRLGCDPTEASSMVSHVRAAYEHAARSTIAVTVGSELVDAVLEHAQKTGTLSEAINRIAGGSAQGFSKLATEYMANLDQLNPAAILNAELPEDVEVRREGSSILVRTPDSQGFVSWPVAVKLGLITLAGR
jgi:hypothetical protein